MTKSSLQPEPRSRTPCLNAAELLHLSRDVGLDVPAFVRGFADTPELDAESSGPAH